MGLFNLFKKKRQKEKTLGKIFNEIFPGGKNEIAKDVSQLSLILNHNYSLSELEMQYVYAASYFHISSDKSRQDIKRYILSRDDNIFSEPDTEKLYEFLKKKFLQKTHSGDDNIIEIISKGVFAGDTGYDLDEIPEGFGEFGLDVTNPIPVQGIISNKVYLKRLITIESDKIRWKREGSAKTDNIENAIDIYKIFGTDGNFITKLFISPYHKRISNKVPKGFMFKN